jgi:hypothetical protein
LETVASRHLPDGSSQQHPVKGEKQRLKTDERQP